jgi:RNA polymerase sigma-70 factor (sigma-E family)
VTRATSQSSFDEFAQARTASLYRAAWMLCGSREEAEDLVQETLAKVFVRMHRRSRAPLDNPLAYAHRTLTNTFVSSRRRRRPSEAPYQDLPEPVTADHAARTELQVTLAEVLAGLRPVDRVIVVLRYLDDLPVTEVARIVGLSPGAVRNRSMRALERIRERCIW